MSENKPVALPARHVHEHHGCFLSERQHGWNACLDEVAKLGPLYNRPATLAPQEPTAWFMPELMGDKTIVGSKVKAGAFTFPLYDRPETAVLTKPAKVGGVRFQAGCTTDSVIQAAIRHYEAEVTPELEAHRIKRAGKLRQDVLDRVYGGRAMNTAPKDGSRILIHMNCSGFDHQSASLTVHGRRWVECWWHGNRWQLWCGDTKTTSTLTVDPMAWMPVPCSEELLLPGLGDANKIVIEHQKELISAKDAELNALRSNLETMRRKNNEYCEEVLALRAQLQNVNTGELRGAIERIANNLAAEARALDQLSDALE